MAYFIGHASCASGDSTKVDTVAKNQLGQREIGSDGHEYRYVQAGASIAATDAVRFNGTALGWDDVRSCSAVAQGVVGIAPVAIASGSFGWIMVNGVTSVKTSGAVAVGVQLVSSAVAGTLAAYANTDITSPVVTVLVNSATPQVVKIGLS